MVNGAKAGFELLSAACCECVFIKALLKQLEQLAANAASGLQSDDNAVSVFPTVPRLSRIRASLKANDHVRIYLPARSGDCRGQAALAADPQAKLLAGGMTLLPSMKHRLTSPTRLIDIGKLPQLRGIRRDGDYLQIGACMRHVEVASDEQVRSHNSRAG